MFLHRFNSSKISFQLYKLYKIQHICLIHFKYNLSWDDLNEVIKGVFRKNIGGKLWDI